MRKTNPLISDDTITAILEIANAYRKSKILLTACELNVFSHIAKEGSTSNDVAIAVGANGRALDRLMNALVVENLLEKKDDLFFNTKGTQHYLSDKSPDFIGNMMHITHLWHRWDTLTESVVKGTAATYQNIEDKDDGWISSYVSSSHWKASVEAPDNVKKINLKENKRLLDLGCGSGAYSMEFAKAYPNLEITALDLPRIIPQTENHLKKFGFEGRIKTIGADFTKDSIGKGYDVIFLSNVLHYFSIWDNIKLIQKCYDALTPDGEIVILEYLIDDDRTAPDIAVLMSLSMLVNTIAGDTFTQTEMWIMLKEGWFSEISMEKNDFGAYLVIGKK